MKNWLLHALVGQKITRESFDSSMQALVSLRASTFHLDRVSGQGGWYRRLGDPGRLGHVATAQMTIFALAAPDSEIQFQACLKFLLGSQASDGGWPFVTNSAGQSVVDATGWVLLAVSEMYDRPSLNAHRASMRAAMERGRKFIEASELPAGGWGITPGADWRALSTAIALRALISLGDDLSNPTIDSAARSLVSKMDPNTGAWCDSRGNLSIAASATSAIALQQVNTNGAFEAPIKRAERWLADVRERDVWGEKSKYVSHEEVDFLDAAGNRSRVEYHFSRRPHAIAALCREGVGPEVCDGLTHLLSAPADKPQQWGGCSQHAWTSWLVFDCWNALSSAQAKLGPDWREVWWSPGRVVVSLRTERFPKTLGRRYWPHLIVLALAAFVVWGAASSGLVDGIGPQTVTFVVTTILLAVLANLISTAILDWQRKKT
ncbi:MULTISPECIES: prenyltransferase/squalene oxidase repeat-containing protein [unclassified Plantibacter]|uniref:prenyltransferase/squalene oxidase repeat-containing protein n=1 Tax=unclassified Plantibacter TaxID=2624265 RepID=UPI000F5F3AAD|nr:MULTISPECIES: prenyltransferase/squalene oxidase repeat-containing protein [unclassified Plantibacter]